MRRSLGICLTSEENPGKLQLEDRLKKIVQKLFMFIYREHHVDSIDIDKDK